MQSFDYANVFEETAFKIHIQLLKSLQLYFHNLVDNFMILHVHRVESCNVKVSFWHFFA